MPGIATLGPQGWGVQEIVSSVGSGAPGKSAYEIWLAAGNTGTQADFLASLKGAGAPTGTMTVPTLGPGTVVSGANSAAITYAGSAWTIGSDSAVYKDGNRQSTGAGAPFTALLLLAADNHLYGLTTANLWWKEGVPWSNVGTTDPRQTTASATTLGTFVIPAWVTGKIASEECLMFPVVEKIAIAAGAAGANGRFKDPATASTTYSLLKNGVQFGTATIAAGASVPTFSVASTVVLDPANNDYLEVVGPATADATLGRGVLNIVATLLQ